MKQMQLTWPAPATRRDPCPWLVCRRVWNVSNGALEFDPSNSRMGGWWWCQICRYRLCMRQKIDRNGDRINSGDQLSKDGVMRMFLTSQKRRFCFQMWLPGRR